MVSKRDPKAQFVVTPSLRDHHNYRLDTADQMRYMRRLPDRTLVYADEYEEQLKEYLAKQQCQ